MDLTNDCPHGDDENRIVIETSQLTDEQMGIYSSHDDELKKRIRYARKNIVFQIICDGFTEVTNTY
jgi:hypothetical protein